MRTRFWIVVAILTISLLGTGAWFSTSLLFLRAIAPTAPGTTIIGSQSNTLLDPFIDRIVEAYLPDGAKQAVAGFSRWVYSHTGGDSSAVVAVSGLASKEDTLNVVGDSQKLGWVTIQSEGDSKQSTKTTIINALQIAFDAVLGHTSFIQPTLYVEFPNTPGPLYASGKLQKEVFSFVYSRVSANHLPLPNKSQEVQGNNKLEVSLPSQFLSMLPPESQGAIQDRIVSELGLTKTNPDVFSKLMEGTVVSMRSGVQQDEHSQFTIGTTGGSLGTAVREWVTQERGYLSPVRQAFRLPDGTLGYELVPTSESNSGFRLPDANGCQQSTIAAGDVWLCQQGDVTTFGRDHDTARDLMIDLARGFKQEGEVDSAVDWHMQLPEEYVSFLQDNSQLSQAGSMSGVYVEGTKDWGRGYLTVK